MNKLILLITVVLLISCSRDCAVNKGMGWGKKKRCGPNAKQINNATKIQ